MRREECFITDFKIIFSGNHWSESDLPGDFFDNTIAEWKNMVRDHDVDDMIAKYTNDCIVIYNDKVLYGKLGKFRTKTKSSGPS